MKKRKPKNIGKEIIAGMEQTLDYVQTAGKPGPKKGIAVHHLKVPEKVDVKAIREHIGLSQADFAARFGFNLRTLQHWEQGDRIPRGYARILLILVYKEPKTIERILQKVA